MMETDIDAVCDVTGGFRSTPQSPTSSSRLNQQPVYFTVQPSGGGLGHFGYSPRSVQESPRLIRLPSHPGLLYHPLPTATHSSRAIKVPIPVAPDTQPPANCNCNDEDESVDLLRMVPDERRDTRRVDASPPEDDTCSHCTSIRQGEQEVRTTTPAHEQVYLNHLMCAKENNRNKDYVRRNEFVREKSVNVARKKRSGLAACCCPGPPPGRKFQTGKAVYPEQKNRGDEQYRRVKRAMFLCCLASGILLASTGIIVGFLVLLPIHMKAVQCSSPGFVYCGVSECLSINQLCDTVNSCPQNFKQFFCNSTNRFPQQLHTDNAVFTQEKMVTLRPGFEETPAPPESNGWYFYANGSSSGSKYTFLERSVTFYRAQESCKDKKAHLVHINTLREQLFIEELVKYEFARNSELARNAMGLWIGAKRARGSHDGTCMFDQWKWKDQFGRNLGVVRGFSAFVPGKPDNKYGPEECLYMSLSHGKSDERYLKWDDAPCDQSVGIGAMRAICEMELR